jgi:hypothetical protein
LSKAKIMIVMQNSNILFMLVLLMNSSLRFIERVRMYVKTLEIARVSKKREYFIW